MQLEKQVNEMIDLMIALNGSDEECEKLLQAVFDHLLRQEKPVIDLTDSRKARLFQAIQCFVEEIVKNHLSVKSIEPSLKTPIQKPFDGVFSLLLQMLQQNWEKLEKAFVSQEPSLPKLVNINWRVDVIVASDKVAKQKTKQVTLELTTFDGSERKTRVFCMSEEQFHSVRYNCAKVLQDMRQLEKHPIMRLAYSTAT